MARPLKRGVRKKEKLKAHGRMTAEKFGRVMGEIEAWNRRGIKINKSDIARRVGLTHSRVFAVGSAASCGCAEQSAQQGRQQAPRGFEVCRAGTYRG